MLVSTEAGAGGAGPSWPWPTSSCWLRADAAGGYSDPEGEAMPGRAASLRVTLRQAVFTADNFGREIRLLARPPGDRSGGAGEAVSAAEL